MCIVVASLIEVWLGIIVCNLFYLYQCLSYSKEHILLGRFQTHL